MKNDKPWVEDLSISANDYANWANQVSADESVTFWALKHNKIEKNQYFEWARNHYELLSLTSDYFQQPANQDLWQQIKSVANWSVNMVPLTQWDGVIFIGCVEPTETNWSFPVQFVLAEPHSLEKYWIELQKEITEVAPVDSPVPVLNLVEQPAPEAPTAKDNPPMEMPAGIFLEPQTTSAPAEVAPIEMPAGMEISIEAAPPLKLDLTPDAPPVNQDPQPTGEVGKGVNKEKDAEAIASLKHTANCDDTELNEAFTTFQQHFSAVLVLVFEGEKLKPWIQDGNWNPIDKNSFDAFEISKPSIFKIVAKTSQPYHGPVSSNEDNDSFFNRWGHAQLPEHVTICPIKYDMHITGMVMAIGSTNSNSLQALSFAEQHTEKLKPLLEKLQINTAA